MRSMRMRHNGILFVLLLASALLGECAAAVVNFPGVEVNVAMGQSAHASSYYDYAPNVLRDTVFVPENAIDGFVDETSWWSSGDAGDEKVFWQMNLTAQPPKLSRIIIRWHGFQTPSSYRVRVSSAGVNFQTIEVVTNQTIEYDRVDTITAGLDKVDTRFHFLRVVFDAANVCRDVYSCDDPADASKVAATGERLVYGIREFELWVRGSKNGAFAVLDLCMSSDEELLTEHSVMYMYRRQHTRRITKMDDAIGGNGTRDGCSNVMILLTECDWYEWGNAQRNARREMVFY